MLPAVEAWSLNHWTAREVPIDMSYFNERVFYFQPDFLKSMTVCSFVETIRFGKTGQLCRRIPVLEMLGIPIMFQ